MRIAVIGSGISGCLVARLLSDTHDVQLFEANDYVGGHSQTTDLEIGGRTFPVDTGFMVFNERTYPDFCRLLKWLHVPSRDSDMSFSVRCDSSGLEYQGSSLNGLFAQRRNLFQPAFLRLLADILRFNRLATAAVQEQRLDPSQTVADFLRQSSLGEPFIHHYLVPMSAAIWSAEPGRILEFPARFLLEFCHNHGLLQRRNRPQWKTIIGGSRCYVRALVAPLHDRIRTSCPIVGVTRTPDHVVVTDHREVAHIFDHVVFATHADQALRMLRDSTPTEQEILSAFPYQTNNAVLHNDPALLPQRRRAWASWNYMVPCEPKRPAAVTYDLRRLQGHASSDPILLTLNPPQEIDPARVWRRFQYAHPCFSRASLAAQARHHEINGRLRTYFCGAYWGYGFHEDGVQSALTVARCFDTSWETCIAPSTSAASHTDAVNP